MASKEPLDYERPEDQPLPSSVSDLWWVRLAGRKRHGFLSGNLRIVYWVVMLSGIGVMLWVIHHMLQPYMNLMAP